MRCSHEKVCRLIEDVQTSCVNNKNECNHFIPSLEDDPVYEMLDYWIAVNIREGFEVITFEQLRDELKSMRKHKTTKDSLKGKY